MESRKHRFVSLALTLVLVGLNIAALNYLLAGWSTARIDLTEEGIFSVSSATRRILSGLDEDLTIHGYFSKRTHPKLAPLVPQITDLLDEYRAFSRGRLRVEIVDPDDEKTEEEAADRFGVSSTPFRLASKYETGIVNAYFALVIRYGDQYERYGFQDLIEVEAQPDGDIDVRLRNLEYDLTRAIKKVVYGFQGANELFERIDQPVRLTAIISPNSLPDLFSDVPDALAKAADELAERGGDKFVYRAIDPTVDQVAHRELEAAFGPVPPMSVSFFGDESFYLYAILEVGDRVEQLVLTSESVSAASIREGIENSLRRHTPGFLKTVGVYSSEPPEIPMQLRMQLQMPPPPPPEFEDLKRFLGQDYQILGVTLDESGGVPSEVDVLLVLKPTALSEEQVYALDQYLMRGGRVVLCAGSFNAEFGAQGLSVTALETGLGDWLSHFGLSLGQELVLDDRNQPLPIPEVRNTPLGAMRTWTMAPYPYLIQVTEDGFLNRDVTATLDTVGIYWGSRLTVDEQQAAGLKVLPLLQSSPRSWTSDDLSQVGYVDYTVPEEGTEPQLLAVALSGRFKSYYAVHPVPGAEARDELPEPNELDAGAEPPEPPSPPPIPLEESPDTRLVVVGNSAFLSDFVARSLGQIDGGFFVENLRFVENLIDWVSLDNDMMEIRSRGLVSRRLAVVDSGTEMTIEVINYIVPVVALIGLGLWLHYRRRNALPLFGAGVRSASASGSPREEV